MTDNVVKKTIGNLVTKMKTLGFLHSDDVVTSWSQSVSNSKYATEKLVKDSLDTKENTGNKSSSISTDTGSTTKYPTVKAVEDYAQPKGNYLTSHQSLSGYVQSSSLGAVAFSNDYDDLDDKPTIPSKTSDLTNDSGFLTSHQDITGKLDKAQTSYKGKNVVVDSTTGNITFEDKNSHTHSQYLTEHQSLSNYVQKNATSGLLKNDGTVDTSSYLTSHQTLKTINDQSLLGSGNISIQGGSGGSNITDYYYDTTNNEIVLEYDSGVTQADIVTSWSSTVSNSNVPSEKLVKDSLDAIGGGTVDSALSSTSENPVQNKVIYTALSNKISTSNTSGLVRNDGTIDTSTYLTSHQDISNYVQKSNTSGLLKNDGSVMTGGTGSTNYAIGNHTHSGYASSSHTHNYSDVNNVSTVTITVTYSNNTTENITLLKYTGS